MFKRIASLFLILMMLAAATAQADGVIDVILSTGTTQAFTDTPVPTEELTVIVQAGLQATSAINQQPWFFAVVTNPDVMAQISASSGFGGAPAGAAAPAGDIPADMGGDFGASSGESSGESSGASSGVSAAPGASTGTAKAALGDSPAAIIIFMNTATMSPDASFDCGLACQNMVIAASSLGYGTKIISSPTNALNGENHAALCEALGVDPALTAVAVLLIGQPAMDAVTSASVRMTLEEKVSFVD